MLTPAEEKWIKEMDRFVRRKPKKLCCYVVDGDYIVVCKQGVSSAEFTDSIRLNVAPGAALTDLHDDSENGKA